MNGQTYIHPDRYKTGFPAVLKLPDGTPLESGQAMVSPETGAVDFAGDFVPLFKMGTPLQIARTFQGEEIHLFDGEVYLSSEQLLRITSVRDKLLPGTEKYYMFPVRYPAALRVLPGKEPPPPQRRWFIRHKAPVPEIPEVISITITGMALDALEFSSPTPLPEGRPLLLSMSAPVSIENVPLEVPRALQFGAVQNCTGRALGLPRSTQRKIEEFIRELHIKNNQIFR